jgi:hypothetical protein
MTRSTTFSRGGAVFQKVTLSAASLAGKAIRLVKVSGAGIAGAALVSVGCGLVYEPLLPIVAGGFLLILDRKRP